MANILLIEDEPQLREMLAEILAADGFDVKTAENGLVGVRMAKELNPDVIISDIIMPGLDGYGVLKELQADARTADIPFIFLTALVDHESLRSGMRLGADDYLVKPVDTEDLIAAVKTRLAKRQAARQYHRSGPEGSSDDPTLEDRTRVFNTSRTVGNYRLLKVIGEGASGVVFLCERVSDKLECAIKLLKMNLKKGKSQEAHVRRFINEANAISQLNHPNIVNFIEFGYSGAGADRHPYIVMEHFPSVSLARRLEEGVDWDYKMKVSVIIQVACAIAAVHAGKIVHRDIKPGNILVDDGLNVKITDFGICHLPASDLTATSNILGTPCYLSPEYLATGTANHLSDIYSLGVVTYELLVGRRPFDAKNVNDLLRIIQKEQPAEPRKVVRDFHPVLESIIIKMMKKKPKQRYQSASELVDALVVFENDVGVPPSLLSRITKGLSSVMSG